MSPSERPRCRATDTMNFADGVEATFSKCLCGRRSGNALTGLMGTIGNAYREAEHQARSQREVQALQAAHLYGLQSGCEHLAAQQHAEASVAAEAVKVAEARSERWIQSGKSFGILIARTLRRLARQ